MKVKVRITLLGMEAPEGFTHDQIAEAVARALVVAGFDRVSDGAKIEVGLPEAKPEPDHAADDTAAVDSFLKANDWKVQP